MSTSVDLAKLACGLSGAPFSPQRDAPGGRSAWYGLMGVPRLESHQTGSSAGRGLWVGGRREGAAGPAPTRLDEVAGEWGEHHSGFRGKGRR